MKEEALKLADSIDEFAQGGYSYKPSDFLKVSAMIRRLVEELDCAEDYIKQYQLQTKPLSDEEIREICKEVDVCFDGVDTYRFARAIEERHGIK